MVMNIISKNFKIIIILVLIVIIILQRSCQSTDQPIPDGYIKINSKEYRVLVDSIKVNYIKTFDSIAPYTPKRGDSIGTTKPQHTKSETTKSQTTKLITAGKKTDLYGTLIKTENPIENNFEIDTNAVIEEYFKKYQYDDVLKISQYVIVDTTEVHVKGNIFLKDILSRNSILERSYTTDIDVPIIEKFKIVEAPAKNKVYIGGNLGFDKTNVINQASTGVLLQTKRDHIYSLNVGAVNMATDPINPSPSITPFVSIGAYWKIRLGKK